VENEQNLAENIGERHHHPQQEQEQQQQQQYQQQEQERQHLSQQHQQDQQHQLQQHQQQQPQQHRQQQHQQQHPQQQEQEHHRDEVGDRFNFIDLRAENARRFRNFQILGREASFAIRPLPEGADTVRWLENAFREIHAYALHSCEPTDYVGLSFDSADLAHGPAGLSFRPARDLTPEDIWGLVSSVAQSAGGIDIAKNFIVRVFNVAAPAGRGGVSNRLTREDVAKRSILQINNTDNLCFPRSIVAARVYCERGNVRTGELNDKWNSVRYWNSVLQRELALQLTRSAGIAIPEEGCGIHEIERFQRFLAAENIAIIVYNFSTFGRGENPLYDGRALLASLGREHSYCLHIMYYERSRHYNPILSLKAAAGARGGYCVACNMGYRNGRSHRCSKKCPRCYASPSCEQPDVEIIKCETCNRAFFGNSCFERHRAERSYDEKSLASVCDSVRICNGCGRFVKSNSRHECDVIFCKTCFSLQSTNHSCFMRPLHRRKTAIENPGEGTSAATMQEEEAHASENEVIGENNREKGRVAFVFYDFETRQDETLEGTENVKIHVPTLCVAQQICGTCAEIDDMSVRCRWCGVREFIFRDDPVKQFVDFATRTTKCFHRIICIAHNAKAFDAQFILKYIVEKSNITEQPRVILNGTKIVVMTIGRTKFIDSINYIPMRLSDLPKAFGLRDTSGKGTFPHLFNTIENQSYIGPLPEARYYSPEQIKPADREQFLSYC